MFGKDGGNGRGGYTHVNGAGTAYLRNTVQSSIYNDDPFLVDKLTMAQLHWKFYNNRHWADNNDELLSFNYCRAVIDKVNNFIIGREGFGIGIVDEYGDELPTTLETKYQALLNYNWRKNNRLVFVKEMFQMGGITGDVYIFLSPNIERGFVEYTMLDSRTCIPMFKNGDYNQIEGYKVYKVLHQNDKKYIAKVSEYTAKMTKTYFVKSSAKDADKYETESAPNSFPWIPVVHIQNVPSADSYGGKSDIEDVVKINKVLNEMTEDVKNIIDYYVEPVTVVTGGHVANMKKGIGQMWSGLPEGAKVFNLTLGEDLTASMNFLKLLKEAIHDLTGVPEEVLSKVQHISNTSAAALQMLYQPIIQVADSKVISYGSGMEELHHMTMLMYDVYISIHPLYAKVKATMGAVDATRFFDRYKADVLFKYNLPNDRMASLQELQLELSMHIGSRREAQERLGKKNIPLLEEQIEADRTKALDETIKQKKAITLSIQEQKEAQQRANIMLGVGSEPNTPAPKSEPNKVVKVPKINPNAPETEG